MNRSLIRPTAALFPLVGLVAALAAEPARDFLLMVYALYYLLQLVSLCAVEGFRNAAACEPGVRRVDRRFAGALVPMLVAAIAALVLTLAFRSNPAEAQPALDHAPYLQRQIACAALSAALISIEHLFEERMFALGRRIDGVVLSCICNGALLAGALIGATADVGEAAFAIATGLGAAISLATNYAVEPLHGLSPISNFSFFPRACLQTLLYPASACAVALLLANGDGARLEAAIPAALFGLIPWRLSRTAARRTADESRSLNLLLIAFAALPAIAAAWLPDALPFAQMGTLALACGTAVFCAPGARLYAGVALSIAAALPVSYPFLLRAIPALAAIAINLRPVLRFRRGARR